MPLPLPRRIVGNGSALRRGGLSNKTGPRRTFSGVRGVSHAVFAILFHPPEYLGAVSMAHNNPLRARGYLNCSKQSRSMTFHGLLLCTFHSHRAQYIGKPAASNMTDKLNGVQYHSAYLCLP